MTSEERNRIMRAVKDRDTVPEKAVRKEAHAMGYRFRLHRADLPGKPDLTFVKRRAVIFVHGCFWHGHGCRRGARLPKTNATYWRKKIARNAEWDAQTAARLNKAGWRTLVIWECQTKDWFQLRGRLYAFLGRPKPGISASDFENDAPSRSSDFVYSPDFHKRMRALVRKLKRL
jgi:DNA mismatch endonuclease (patch repair protein)